MANSIQNLLMQVETGVTNALSDSDIMSALEQFGYNEAAINEGQTLLSSARLLHQQQLKEYGEQYTATEDFNNKKDSAYTEYLRFVKIARVALKNEPAAFQKLGLHGDRKDSFSGWLSQAEQFYTNALQDTAVQSRLNRFGITVEKLNTGRQLAEEARLAQAAKTKETGEAQQATLSRDKAIDELSAWSSDFFAIARIALEEKPQLLEKLGVLARS